MITVYVYPIAATDWENQQQTLDNHMNLVMEEVQHAVELGKYSRVGEATRTDFNFEYDGKEFRGLKSTFNAWLKEGDTQLDSNAYLFISEDKFIKFRTSFDSLLTPDWNGDEIVKEILPELIVPPESPYMKNLREEHRQAQQQQLIELLMKAMEEGENTTSSEAN